MSKKSESSQSDKDTVIAPGGPRERETVHAVKESEIVYAQEGYIPVVTQSPWGIGTLKMNPSKAQSSDSALVLASYSWGQRDLVFEQRRHPHGEYTYAPFDHHLISIQIGAPVEAELTVDGYRQRTMIRPGHITLIPAGRATVWKSAKTSEFLNIQLNPAFLARIAARENDMPEVELATTFTTSDARLESLGSLLAMETQNNAPNGPLYAESLATAVAAHVVNNYVSVAPFIPSKTTKPSVAQFQRVTEYIQAHLARRISVAELAALVGLSPNYFVSQFRQVTGMSPHQYLLKRRVERAQHLLVQSATPVTEVAIAVGFVDQSHLTRHMRRFCGLTPSAFRHQQRKNIPEDS